MKSRSQSTTVMPVDGQVHMLTRDKMIWWFEPKEWIWHLARNLCHVDVEFRKPETLRGNVILFPSENYGNMVFNITDEGWEMIKAILDDDFVDHDPEDVPIVSGPADWPPEDVRHMAGFADLIVALSMGDDEDKEEAKEGMREWKKRDARIRAAKAKRVLPERWVKSRQQAEYLSDEREADLISPDSSKARAKPVVRPIREGR